MLQDDTERLFVENLLPTLGSTIPVETTNEIGVINNASSTINSIFLSSASTDIFGFENDGICGGYTFSATPGACSTVDASGYGPGSVTFIAIKATNTSGTVNFAGGIAPGGGSAFFSLEGPVDLNLTVAPSQTPEPSSLMLLGTGVLGLAGAVRRKLMA